MDPIDVPAAVSSAASESDAADAVGIEANDASLLTRQEPVADEPEKTPAEGQEGEKPDSQPPDEADPLMQIPATADEYQIAFADDVAVDEGLLSSFKAKAHELGIAQGQAQKLAEFYAQSESQRTAAQMLAAAETKQDWEQQIMSSPTFRKDAGDARKTLIAFGSFGAVNEKGEPAIHTDIKNIFDESLVGSHPKVFQMFVDIGKALAEPEARGRGIGGGIDKPLPDRLWPNMK